MKSQSRIIRRISIGEGLMDNCMKYTVGQVIFNHTITSIIEEDDRYIIYWMDKSGVTKYWKDFNKNMAISTENDTTYGED